MLREKWQAWPIGIIAVILYGYSCYVSNLYGELILQCVYVTLSIYGYIKWRKNGENKLIVKKLTEIQLFTYLLLASLLSFIFYFLLNSLNSSLPFWDAITNGFAITATYLAAKKKIENWIFWVPINLLTVYIMTIKHYPFYAILYFCYAVFALYGFFLWRKKMLKKPTTSNL